MFPVIKNAPIPLRFRNLSPQFLPPWTSDGVFPHINVRDIAGRELGMEQDRGPVHGLNLGTLIFVRHVGSFSSPSQSTAAAGADAIARGASRYRTSASASWA